MARLSLTEIALAARGEVILGARPPAGGAAHEVTGYGIDSRSVGPGELFFAIVGPRNDGHRFVAAAVERGAAAAVVSEGGAERFPEAAALVRVEDTTRALQEIAAHVRRRRPVRVIGITGSAGKTTAKEMTAAVAAERFATFKSQGNLNNAWGLPLMLLRLPDDAEVAVLEMGMSYHGEIARLVEIADPDVGTILNVLPVHLEHFSGVEDIARAKGEMFRGLRHDAVAVFNADDPSTDRLGRAFPGARLGYGIDSKKADVIAEQIVLDGVEGSRFVLRHGAARAAARLGFPGRHNVYNALAATAAGLATGMDLDAAAEGLRKAVPAGMRGVVHHLRRGIVLLDDSYNSNPAAMERALEMLRHAAPEGRRVVVSGDMLELGPKEAEAHARLGAQAAAAGVGLFVVCGALSRHAYDAARAAASGALPLEAHHFADASEAAGFVAASLRPGDLVLVKGSRGARMERVVQAILAAHGQGAGT